MPNRPPSSRTIYQRLLPLRNLALNAKLLKWDSIPSNYDPSMKGKRSFTSVQNAGILGPPTINLMIYLQVSLRPRVAIAIIIPCVRLKSYLLGILGLQKLVARHHTWNHLNPIGQRTFQVYHHSPFNSILCVDRSAMCCVRRRTRSSVVMSFRSPRSIIATRFMSGRSFGSLLQASGIMIRVSGGHFSSIFGRKFLMTTRSMNWSGEQGLKEGFSAINSLWRKSVRSVKELAHFMKFQVIGITYLKNIPQKYCERVYVAFRVIGLALCHFRSLAV